MATFQEQDMLLKASKLLSELRTNRGSVYLIEGRLVLAAVVFLVPEGHEASHLGLGGLREIDEGRPVRADPDVVRHVQERQGLQLPHDLVGLQQTALGAPYEEKGEADFSHGGLPGLTMCNIKRDPGEKYCSM
jgi:hypothetical protein